jgi:hypothetical protein
MVAGRGLATRLAVALLAVAGLAGCEQAQQVGQGVDRTRDCAALVKEVANLDLDAQSVARAASRAEETARRLDQAARNVDQDDVRRAGENLAAKVEQLADTAANSTPAQRERAVRGVTDAATRLASTCGVSLDQVIQGS